MHPKMLQKGRIIDLSQVASKKLIINSKGIIKVAIEAIGYSKTTPKT
jgi:rare lipoprotein A (peptidoglycan hydrolase)